MTTEESLDGFVKSLRDVMIDHRTASFKATYPHIRHWFLDPVTDRRADAFQIVFGSGSSGQPYFSFCRLFERQSDGAYIQAWITMDHWNFEAKDRGWQTHCWYGKDFSGIEELFKTLESAEFFPHASELNPWHVKVSWQRNGEQVTTESVHRDLERSILR